MDYVSILKWLHVLGGIVLIGTGAGIAFFMVMAQRTGNVEVIAHTASSVVVADWLFTASAAVAQPITGTLLAWEKGWELSEPWIVWALVLYVFVGGFWLPVVWIQHELRDLARAALAQGQPLPPRYHKLFRVWFACGFPAFFAILAILWLMVARPGFGA